MFYNPLQGAGKGWASEENVLACKSYLAHAPDPEKGSGKKPDVFHRLVGETYTGLSEELVLQYPMLRDRMHPRTGRAIAQRFKKRIRAECLAIEAHVLLVKQARPTGSPSEEDILRFAIALSAGTPMAQMYDFLRNPERVSLVPCKWLSCLRYLRSTPHWAKTVALAVKQDKLGVKVETKPDVSSESLAVPNGTPPIAPSAGATVGMVAVGAPGASAPLPPGAALGVQPTHDQQQREHAGPAAGVFLPGAPRPMMGMSPPPGLNGVTVHVPGMNGVHLPNGVHPHQLQHLGNGMPPFAAMPQPRPAGASPAEALVGRKRPFDEAMLTDTLTRCAAGLEKLSKELTTRNKISADMLALEKQKYRIQLFSMPGTSEEMRDRFIRIAQDNDLQEMEKGLRGEEEGDAKVPHVEEEDAEASPAAPLMELKEPDQPSS